MDKRGYKSVFISDIHLGTDICQHEKLLNFLKSLESGDKSGYDIDNLFLVGDIIDFIAMKRNNQWNRGHTTIIQKLLRMSRKGVKIKMIFGNHDIAMSMVDGWFFGDIQVIERYIYDSINGNKILILHGHQFDSFAKTMPWLYWLGDYSYNFALCINKWFNRIRWLFGFEYWSLSYYLKTKVKCTLSFMTSFNTIISKECLNSGVDGVIYGHTHLPCDKTINDKRIMNIGCGTEITTCIVETWDGDFKIIDFGEIEK
jgi:UDP-2,3-diacylglucosamine pyrophosphatase LpxH